MAGSTLFGYNHNMHLFKNYWFRWFAGAFIIGAAVPTTAVAFATDQFQDLEIEFGSGALSISGATAWIATALLCGVSAGIFGLAIAAFKNSNRKAFD